MREWGMRVLSSSVSVLLYTWSCSVSECEVFAVMLTTLRADLLLLQEPQWPITAITSIRTPGDHQHHHSCGHTERERLMARYHEAMAWVWRQSSTELRSPITLEELTDEVRKDKYTHFMWEQQQQNSPMLNGAVFRSMSKIPRVSAPNRSHIPRATRLKPTSWNTFSTAFIRNTAAIE